MISGIGFAIAKTMASVFMDATISFVTRPGPETPINTSAPFIASARVPDSPLRFVMDASSAFAELDALSLLIIPFRSQQIISVKP
jgi:hypothetical protein